MNAGEPPLGEEMDSTKLKTDWAHSWMSYSECNTVSNPLRLEKPMDFPNTGTDDVTHSKVVKVRSINYDFKEGIKSPFIGKLEVEVIFHGMVVKHMQYGDVVAMDGGKDAVAEFAPITQMFV